jgi:putative ABC transport system permease protein
MLLGDKAKYLGIVCGVMLAALLMSHQVTIFVGLMSRTRSIFQNLPHADLIVADPATEFVEDVRGLSDTHLQRVRGVAGVEWAVPLMRTNIKATLAGGKSRTAIVVGLDDASLIGGPVKMHRGSLEDLRRTDGVIIDRLDAEKLLSTRLADGTQVVPGVGDTIELNDHRARVVAISDNPRPFLSQPIIYTTLSRARTFAPPERRSVSYILARLVPGADAQAVKGRIAAETGLSAYTRVEFGSRTISYFIRNTGIPVNFGVTVLLGCIVGIAISGQTFYLFTLDNLKNLAALKAMGASTAQLVRMVVLQAAVVGLQGFGLGIGLTALFFVAFIGTDLEFQVHWEVLALTGAGIVVVILLAIAASLRSVLAVEPAIVFRG